jgi:hypothetical protein
MYDDDVVNEENDAAAAATGRLREARRSGAPAAAPQEPFLRSEDGTARGLGRGWVARPTLEVLLR